jgi:hypothetical protein
MQSQETVLYSHASMSVSLLSTRSLGVTIAWRPWDYTHIQVLANGTISLTSFVNKTKPVRVLQLKSVVMSLIQAGGDLPVMSANDLILLVKCQKINNTDTYFRCVVDNTQLYSMVRAVRRVAGEHNAEEVLDALRSAFIRQQNDEAIPQTRSCSIQ